MVTITGVQVRTARTLLAWSEAELATASGVPEPTIESVEARDGPLDGLALPIRSAFETAGVEFTDGSDHGVRLGPTWILHRVADRAEVDSLADGEAKVIRCAGGLRCIASSDGEVLGTVRDGPSGVVTDPDIGARPAAEGVTPSDIRTWVSAALKKLHRG